MYEGSNVHFTTNNKPLCSFSGKLCNLRRLNGYAFCVRHILEDQSAPFKQCMFLVKTSGQRCTSAIPRAENRQYCNAHMQVMGIIPKKERKKKMEPSFLADGNGFLNLDNFKLPNGYTTDNTSNSHKLFSASKMFPELAGKLSLDNQKNCDLNSDETGNNSLTKSSSKTPATSNSLSAKRSRKPTRKYLSMLKRKQFGLLTDEEAKASLTDVGCKAYSQYAKAKMVDSALLTPLIDSSDDESSAFSPLITYNLNTSCSSLSSSTDLNAEFSDSDSDGESNLRLKRACIQLSRATHLNHEVTEYMKHFTSYFLETMSDNLTCAATIAEKMRPTKVASRVPSTPAEGRTFVSSSVADSRQRCTYHDQEEKRCNRPPIPLTSHCSKHLIHSAEQKIFHPCTFSHPAEGDEESKICALPAIDTGQGPVLCQTHLPRITDPFVPEQDLNLRRKKKKSKPFAFRRTKKRKKVLKPQKPMLTDIGKAVCLSSSSELSSSMSNAAHMPKLTSSPTQPEDNELDSDADNILSPLDKSLLPLGHDDSKILDDNEIDEVLNEEDLILFPESVKNEVGIDLTDAEADLIFSGNSGELLDELKGELPDDITDAILHVEYEAEMEKQQQQRQQQLPQAHPVQQPTAAQQQQAHRMLQQQQSTGVYEMAGGMDGYTETAADYHPMHQPYNHQGPPPDYPGATKLMPTQHINIHNNLGYMHEQANRYTHHQIHPKISTTSVNNAQMLHRQSSYHLPPSSPLSLSASSTQLNTAVNRMGRLPPVSTITMQPWHGSESTPYQNGFHSPTEHHLYQHNGGLPSPPHYQAPREHRIMYSTQLYNNGAYSINRTLRPPHPQRINMPMQ